MEREPLFLPYRFDAQDRARLDREGHLVLPGILAPEARAKLTEALSGIEAMPETPGQRPQHYAAEHDAYLARLIGHPQMLALARGVLGPDIRYDHCVSLNRAAGNQGIGWHSHGYADERPELGFLRIFLYVNGFGADDGGLKVAPGSHLFRDPAIKAGSDEELRAGWLAGKRHPETGEQLEIERLGAPYGTVVLMWTHAAHAVSPRKPGSDVRWAVVYAYRNPGMPSRARWITEAFERQPVPGAQGLMRLY